MQPANRSRDVSAKWHRGQCWSQQELPVTLSVSTCLLVPGTAVALKTQCELSASSLPCRVHTHGPAQMSSAGLALGERLKEESPSSRCPLSPGQ